MANGANNAGRNQHSCFFISVFNDSVIPSINTFEYPNDFMILIISFISSFKINKTNPFPASTAPFPSIFLSNIFIAFEAKLLANLGKLFLANEIETFVRTFVP